MSLEAAFQGAIQGDDSITFDAELKKEQLQLRAEGVELGICLPAINKVLLSPRFLGDESNRLSLQRLRDLGLDPASAVEKVKIDGVSARKDVAVVYLHANVVKPLTASAQCALIDMFLGLRVAIAGPPGQHGEGVVAESQTLDAVGRMTVFHSYAWLSGWHYTHATLLANLGPYSPAFLWWDLFCQNQHKVSNVDKTFDVAMKQADVCLFSVQSASELLPLGRMWCLFEAAAAMRHKTRLIVGFLRLQSTEVEEYRTHKGRHERTFKEIDVRNASAKFDKDRRHILQRLEDTIDGGLEEVNARLQRTVLTAYQVGLLATAVRKGNMQHVDDLIGGLDADQVEAYTMEKGLQAYDDAMLKFVQDRGLPVVLSETARFVKELGLQEDDEHDADDFLTDSDFDSLAGGELAFGSELEDSFGTDSSDSDTDDDSDSDLSDE